MDKHILFKYNRNVQNTIPCRIVYMLISCYKVINSFMLLHNQLCVLGLSWTGGSTISEPYARELYLPGCMHTNMETFSRAPVRWAGDFSINGMGEVIRIDIWSSREGGTAMAKASSILLLFLHV